ncbi:MAG: dihydroorotate dehydrogenase electron transfer subunit [Endomicrobium sp.]|uniref:dihydroorotate dehydrogenase electron transfer subunit n=1 Tax=Candidatus Endomicrobiellum pyrsonymphae TaxID=1408203 RepID=UPI00358BFF5B|nr:dihydroorotate dehydrogenase electron transfer subunit [Endomicrobium sp.]
MSISKRFDKSCKIISNKEICNDYFELKIKVDGISKHCFPGQFFMIGAPGVFLRRPISVHDVGKNTSSFLYKVVGKGTKILSSMRSGELQLLGPLGKGYDLETYKESNHVIVAGGTGIASVYFLATKLKKKGILYYGARSKKDLLCLDKFKKIGWKVDVSTEDGSKGHKGYITDVLAEKLKENDVIFVCGPTPMLKKVSQIAKSKNVKGFASLEEKMACGVGNCQGCAVKINGQIKMTCKDGPVFKIEQVEL